MCSKRDSVKEEARTDRCRLFFATEYLSLAKERDTVARAPGVHPFAESTEI